MDISSLPIMPSQVPPTPPPPDVDDTAAAPPVAASDDATAPVTSLEAAAGPSVPASAPTIPAFIAAAQKERARRAKAARDAKDAVVLRKYLTRWRAAGNGGTTDDAYVEVDVQVDPSNTADSSMDVENVEPTIEYRALAVVAEAAADLFFNFKDHMLYSLTSSPSCTRS